MSINDVLGILRGDKDVVICYFECIIFDCFYNEFNFVIVVFFDKFNVCQYWVDVVNIYNCILFIGDDVDFDFDDYVICCVLDGLFVQVVKEEFNIWNNISV